MMLQQVANDLAAVYDMPMPEVLPFVGALPDHSEREELLLISRCEDGVAVGLRFSSRLLAHCQRESQATLTLNDWAIIVEGISHLLYALRSFSFDRPVSQLELELQAEIDKFALAIAWHRGAYQRWHRRLFVDVDYLDSAGAQRWRYQQANDLAGAFCQMMIDRYLHTGRGNRFWRRLRQVYRLPGQRKVAAVGGAI